jgi:hypothetical protein
MVEESQCNIRDDECESFSERKNGGALKPPNQTLKTKNPLQ